MLTIRSLASLIASGRVPGMTMILLAIGGGDRTTMETD